MKKKLLYAFAVVVAVLVLIFASGLGGKVTNWGKERSQLRSIIRNDPKFENLKIEFASIGYCYVQGKVDSQDDYNNLVLKVETEFGDSGAKLRARLVRVRSK